MKRKRHTTTKQQKITLTIEELGGMGDGITHHQQRKLFVPYTLAGEEVEVAIQGSSTKALLERVITPSPERVEAACKHFTRCGGCSLQHLSDEFYYNFKRSILEQAVMRAGYDKSCVKDVVRIGRESRRRIQLKVNKQGKQVSLGYNEARSHQLVNISECPIMDKRLFALVAPLRGLIALLHVAIDEISLTMADSGIDILITSKTFPELADTEQLVAFANKYSIARITWQENQQMIPICELQKVMVKMGNVDVTVPADTFLQATHKGQEVIVGEVVATTKNAKHVLDLYAGCGTFTFPVSAHAKVHAVEGSASMMTTLARAAASHQLNGIVTTETRDLLARPLLPKEMKNYDAAIINPPRNGAEMQTAELAQSNIPTIVMVSCNPATFSRDAALLQQAGYTLEKAIAIDQFYWSSHLELIAVFSK